MINVHLIKFCLYLRNGNYMNPKRLKALLKTRPVNLHTSWRHTSHWIMGFYAEIFKI